MLDTDSLIPFLRQVPGNLKLALALAGPVLLVTGLDWLNLRDTRTDDDAWDAEEDAVFHDELSPRHDD